MAIAKTLFNGILRDIFKEGNTIELFSIMPDEDTESGYTKISGIGYTPYTIRSGDFSVTNGEATSSRNILLYLCDTAGGHGTARGFGVFGSSGLLYFGEFEAPISIGYNTVPTIKKYDSAKQEGIKVTVTSTEASATAE